MGVVWGLVAAVCFGGSDFAAGLASRRYAAGPVTAITQVFAVVTMIVAVALVPGGPPTVAALSWGAIGGIANGFATLALYRGLAGTAMSVAAACSAVTAAVIPALVDLALGTRISPLAAAGICVAVPAIAMVSWMPSDGRSDGVGRAHWSGVGYGLASGVGFAVLFIAIDRAGTEAGAWPLLPSAAVAVLVALPFARTRVARPARRRVVLVPTAVAGVLGGAGMLSFLAATGSGTLTIVAVLTSLYPAVTILAARGMLAERWTRTQGFGLLAAAAAITLISIA